MFGERLMKDELVIYIKKNLRKGYTKEALRWALIDQGYSKMEVDNAIKSTDQELAQQAPILKTKPEIRHQIILVDEKPKKKWFGLFGR